MMSGSSGGSSATPTKDYQKQEIEGLITKLNELQIENRPLKSNKLARLMSKVFSNADNELREEITKALKSAHVDSDKVQRDKLVNFFIELNGRTITGPNGSEPESHRKRRTSIFEGIGEKLNIFYNKYKDRIFRHGPLLFILFFFYTVIFFRKHNHKCIYCSNALCDCINKWRCFNDFGERILECISQINNGSHIISYRSICRCLPSQRHRFRFWVPLLVEWNIFFYSYLDNSWVWRFETTFWFSDVGSFRSDCWVYFSWDSSRFDCCTFNTKIKIRFAQANSKILQSRHLNLPSPKIRKKEKLRPKSERPIRQSKLRLWM